jgi:hypothetical protein
VNALRECMKTTTFAILKAFLHEILTLTRNSWA